MMQQIAEQRVHVELVSFVNTDENGEDCEPKDFKCVRDGNFFFDMVDVQIEKKIRHMWHDDIDDPAKVVVLISRPFHKA